MTYYDLNLQIKNLFILFTIFGILGIVLFVITVMAALYIWIKYIDS